MTKTKTKTRWLAILGVAVSIAFISIVLSSGKGARDKKHELTAQKYRLKDGQYHVQLSTQVASEGQTTQYLLLDGLLDSVKVSQDETLSSWADVSRLVAMGVEEQGDPLKGQTALTRFEGGQAIHQVKASFPEKYGDFERSFLNKLFVNIDTSETKTSRTEIEDGHRYDVAYTIEKRGDGTKVMTRRWTMSLDATVKIDEKSNSLVYLLDESNQLVSLTGELILFTNAPGTASAPFVKQNIEVSFQADKIVDMKPAKNALVRTDYAPLLGVSSDGVEALTEPPKISLVDTFKMVDALTGDTAAGDRADIYNLLEAHLNFDPKNINAFKDRILSMKAESDTEQLHENLLFSVIAGNERSETSDFLVDMATSDCKTLFCRSQALSAYNFHPNVTVESAKRLEALAATDHEPVIAANAYLALSHAEIVLGDKYKDADEILLRAEKDHSEENSYRHTGIVSAMGNLGNREFLPVLNTMATSSDADDKATALFNMRFVPGEDVTAKLMNSIKVETKDEVVEEAIKAMQYRTLTKADVDTLADTVKNWPEDTESIQTRAAELLVDIYKRNPEIAKEGLESLQKDSKIKMVRDYIAVGMKDEVESQDSDAPTPEPETVQ